MSKPSCYPCPRLEATNACRVNPDSSDLSISDCAAQLAGKSVLLPVLQGLLQPFFAAGGLLIAAYSVQHTASFERVGIILPRPTGRSACARRCYAPAVGHEIVHQPAVVLDPAGHPVYGQGTAAGLVPASSKLEVSMSSSLCMVLLCLCRCQQKRTRRQTFACLSCFSEAEN